MSRPKKQGREIKSREHMSKAKRKTTQFPFEIVGVSKYFVQLRKSIKKVAEQDNTVLITGPSGTGKELIARNIHQYSNRRSNKFIAINCANLTPDLADGELFGVEPNTATGVRGRLGLISEANHGTLFLDEVGDLQQEVQGKLLRFLDGYGYQSVGGRTLQQPSVRVIAATNKDIEDGKTFRNDLYQRLAQDTIKTEPLAGKMGDIITLVNRFFPKNGDQRVKFLLYHYDFPGNTRELKNLCRRDYDSIIDLLNKKADDLNDYIVDAIEFIESPLDIFEEIDYGEFADLGITEDPETLYKKLLNYEFTDADKEILNIIRSGKLNEQKYNREIERKILAMYNKQSSDDLFEFLLEKRRKANKKLEMNLIKHIVDLFSIIYLAQKHDLSKKAIADILHIRDEKLSHDNFNKRYMIEYPKSNNHYYINTCLDVFPFPNINEDFDDDFDDSTDDISNCDDEFKRLLKIK